MAGARQPIELVKAKGKKHLTKSEIEQREQTEVKAFADNLEPPVYLNRKQKAEFKKLAAELARVGIMTNLDCDLLARFIIASDLYTYFTEKLFDEEVREDIFEMEKVSNMQDKYYKQCLSASKEIGLTISSRCKLVMPGPEKEENPIIRAIADDG